MVNFGSVNVALFERSGAGYAFSRNIAAASAPVSVAFGNNHLYILGTTTVESHAISSSGVSWTADGVSPLLIADGSAAQVMVHGLEEAPPSSRLSMVPMSSTGVGGSRDAEKRPSIFRSSSRTSSGRRYAACRTDSVNA